MSIISKNSVHLRKLEIPQKKVFVIHFLPYMKLSKKNFYTFKYYFSDSDLRDSGGGSPQQRHKSLTASSTLTQSNISMGNFYSDIPLQLIQPTVHIFN